MNDCVVLYVDAERRFTLGRSAGIVGALSMTECHSCRNTRTIAMCERTAGKSFCKDPLSLCFHFEAASANPEADNTVS